MASGLEWGWSAGVGWLGRVNGLWVWLVGWFLVGGWMGLVCVLVCVLVVSAMYVAWGPPGYG